MSVIHDEFTLAEKRELLRQRLRLQRQMIAKHLDDRQITQRLYPRSFVMRFLMRRPDLALKLITKFSGLLTSKSR